jgi:hypothetical protein
MHQRFVLRLSSPGRDVSFPVKQALEVELSSSMRVTPDARIRPTR